jgi:hypothetical protein
MAEAKRPAPDGAGDGAVSVRAAELNRHHHLTWAGPIRQRPPSPVEAARVGLVRSELRPQGTHRLQAGRAARHEWAERGLTLDQRDPAVDLLISGGEVTVAVTPGGVVVHSVRAGAPQ